MIENFNGIFYLILYIISIGLAGYYSFTFLFNKEKEFAKYNIDTSAAPAANFGNLLGNCIFLSWSLYFVYRTRRNLAFFCDKHYCIRNGYCLSILFSF